MTGIRTFTLPEKQDHKPVLYAIVIIKTAESGNMTKDLALILHGKNLSKENYLNTEEFLDALDEGPKERFN